MCVGKTRVEPAWRRDDALRGGGGGNFDRQGDKIWGSKIITEMLPTDMTSTSLLIRSFVACFSRYETH